MSVINLKQFEVKVRTNRGRPSIILEGDVNEKAAWKLLKQMETFHPSRYPIYLDIGGVRTIHWFAANILKSGFEHLLKSRGEIFLIQGRKKPEPLSHGNFSLTFSPAEGKSHDVS